MVRRQRQPAPCRPERCAWACVGAWACAVRISLVALSPCAVDSATLAASLAGSGDSASGSGAMSTWWARSFGGGASATAVIFRERAIDALCVSRCFLRWVRCAVRCLIYQKDYKSMHGRLLDAPRQAREAARADCLDVSRGDGEGEQVVLCVVGHRVNLRGVVFGSFSCIDSVWRRRRLSVA